ncbi:MOSC N-terminal beta barrel domain-containing protein [Flavobacterium sp. FZUC8N2.13]|uniref:MOSC N-terminal beta barrel domain-containing protein n=1 Tax=Flavobacterium zubiriense TaxID=3138075 RepID=A0ABV4TBT9_9FLAO|nr:MAG: MOSC domain-containing protein [Flavobacteriales bacterium 32-34-25]
MLQLSEIWIYPVKSLGGIALQHSKVTDRGLEHDRRWLLVDENDCFITQREHPKLALFQPEIAGDFLKISHKDVQESVAVSLFPVLPETTTKIKVTVWEDVVAAFEVSPEVSDWFSSILGFNVRLVYMPDESLRKVDPDYAVSPNNVTSFSDGFPFLIIGQSSLDDLNSRMAKAVSIRRFRPNFVFSGGKAYEEERWEEFTIGTLSFYGVKPSGRCVMITVDPESGTISGKDPLLTLSKYKTKGNKVIFGQNVIAQQQGSIGVNDVVKVQKRI